MKNVFTPEALACARRSIRGIAEQQGMTEEQVRKEMMEAMRAGMQDPAPEVHAMWAAIPWSTGEPTAEEFIAWMAAQIDKGIR